MKVLSIKQPWATLIVEGYKCFEFRSWKTNFRGKFLIHASKGIENENMDRFRCLNLEYPTGCIIGSAEITDCIKVEKEFENRLIVENELIYGATRGRGGYALKLEKIKKLEKPIPAIGSLGFWDYYDEFEIMKKMEEIQYGWIDKNNKPHEKVDNDFSENYRLQSPREIIKSKIGVCWDQVELERYYFKGNDWNIETYFLVHYDDDMCPSHTFLTFEKNGKFYWFEHSYQIYRGIHEYNSKKELFLDVKNKFIEHRLENNYIDSKLVLHEYKKPKYGISVPEFYQHCDFGRYIDFKEL